MPISNLGVPRGRSTRATQPHFLQVRETSTHACLPACRTHTVNPHGQQALCRISDHHHHKTPPTCLPCSLDAALAREAELKQQLVAAHDVFKVVRSGGLVVTTHSQAPRESVGRVSQVCGGASSC